MPLFIFLLLSLVLHTDATNFTSTLLQNVSKSDFLTDPIDVARKEGYDLPICRQILSNDEHWGDWSECSARCGSGVQVAAMNDIGKNVANFQKCAIKQRIRPCTGVDCPQDCAVSQWSPYDSCDQSSGKQSRTRSVVLPQKGTGVGCPPLQEIQDCMVDCKHSQWSLYSECNKTTGLQVRTREVIHPALNGGYECGKLEQYVDCVVDCEEDQWGPWSDCNPATGTMVHTRGVVVEPRNNGNICSTMEISSCAVNCKLSEWEPWGACISESGVQSRQRTILITAKNGGTPCDEPAHDTQLQEFQSCDVDCRVSDWEPWGLCNNVTGLQSRVRQVAQIPKNNGNPCPQLIDYQSCTVDCVASDWSEYGPCDPETGLMWRTRKPLVKELNNGIPCTLEEFNTCPVNAQVGPWSSWSTCAEHGPMKGTKVRSREVITFPKNGGLDVPELQEIEDCNVDCQTDVWLDWSPCDIQTGTRNRSRNILVTPVNNGLDCVTFETQDCPVDCEVGDWTSFGKCDEQTHVRTRTRSVIVPSLNGGGTCPPLQEDQDCQINSCQTGEWGVYSDCDQNTGTQTRLRNLTSSINPPPPDCILSETIDCAVSCTVSPWGEWSECSSSGEYAGTKIRNRVVLTKPMNGGEACPDLTDVEICNVDCQVGVWGAFTECDKTSGLQWRTREILIPKINNGTNCPTLSDSQDCLGYCDYPWGQWSECDIKKGTQTRSRLAKLTNKKVEAGCELSQTIDCPVACVVSEWNAYSECDPESGLQRRKRTVITQPLNNGVACPSLEEHIPCVVDCKAGGWQPWSDCDPATGTQNRTKQILVHAKNGGDNSQCTQIVVARCAVDCQLDGNLKVVVRPLNGGQSCFNTAIKLKLNGVKINPALYKSNDLNLYIDAKVPTQSTEHGIVKLVCVTTALAFTALAVGFFTAKREINRGYTIIANRA